MIIILHKRCLWCLWQISSLLWLKTRVEQVLWDHLACHYHHVTQVSQTIRSGMDQTRPDQPRSKEKKSEHFCNVDIWLIFVVFVIFLWKWKLMFLCTLSLIHSINGGNCVTLSTSFIAYPGYWVLVDIVTRRWLQLLEFESNRATHIVSTYNHLTILQGNFFHWYPL